MAQANKVIPLGGHLRARARLSPKESQHLLAGCRELALKRMTRALSGMLDRVEDELFELAEKALDREAQNTYLDARSQAREKRVDIENAFGRFFVEFFNRKMEGEKPVAPPPDDSEELALVGDEDLEESLAVRAMATKLRSACEGELGALSQRMGFLLERPDLEDDANPVSPTMICAALKGACDQIHAGFKVRMALMRQLECNAEAELLRIYHDLNAHLVERRILPDVRPGIRRASEAPARPRSAPAPRAPESAPVASPDVLGSLMQLIEAARASEAPAAGAAVAGAAPAQQSVGVPASFLSELTRMHRQRVPGVVAPDDALLNVVKRIKAAPQSASLGTVDAMTIDIVAMLFDFIFDDRELPSSVKALLGRLQIPTLKVALIDKGFFSSHAHPARRLLDLLAQAAIGLEETSPREAPALAFIAGTVDKVLSDFDTDLGLFESLCDGVAAFIQDQQRVESGIVERSARAIEERERAGIALALAEEEVERRLAPRAWVPAPVREMIVEAWVPALASAQRTEGEGSVAWNGLLATMEDLLWSVEPKTTAEERKRLVTLLPAMIKSLQEGMARGELAEERRNAFLGVLVDCHAAAVKAGLRGLAALPPSPPPVAEPAAAPAAPEIEREMVPAGGIRVEEVRLRATRGAAGVRNVFTRTGIWTNLQRGTWVQFARAGSSAVRARLTWISPNKGVYLFTNPLDGAAAMSITPEALAEQMRLGEARILDDAPLVGRAVDSMLSRLRDKTAEARSPSP